ncbi:Mevalonate kinase [Croceitalea dokdonensis DOKDO 023]|uniref:Mevalonate kinase n=1 Tax=Croceitalea dokdonensis DOKDO 023 TaxID=1300341 RepID=A0A0P7B3I9_9FLAO|nr:galactokinase family protein [Croceitalea dokdonensis]KPM33073.1 Mevalonate kinase [Croceitalea dokdonensis DOKDO 023]
MIHIKAPARVCLFGDHQDYLGLPIIACAIDRHITLNAHPNEASELCIRFLDIDQKRQIPVPYLFHNYHPEDTLLAALKVLQRYNCAPDKGYDITISGNIPINAGLSSSSALVICWVAFLLKAFGGPLQYNQEFIAKIAYEAEVVEQNSPGGKMDQYSIALGNIIYLETTGNNAYRTFPHKLPGLVIGESGIPKNTLGLLAEKRQMALEALEFLKQDAILFDVRKVDAASISSYLDALPRKLRPYFNAAVGNYLVTQKALLEMEKNELDLPTIGKLMTEHHTFLERDLKITVPKIDAMIRAALQYGAYGAKIVGSGGGGCMVALVPQGKENAIIEHLKNLGATDAYTVAVSNGITL